MGFEKGIYYGVAMNGQPAKYQGKPLRSQLREWPEGGTIYYDGNYRMNVFYYTPNRNLGIMGVTPTSVQYLTYKKNILCPKELDVSIFIIAAGGYGSCGGSQRTYGGGGGAGGVSIYSNYSLGQEKTLEITVGCCPSTYVPYANGQPSFVVDIDSSTILGYSYGGGTGYYHMCYAPPPTVFSLYGRAGGSGSGGSYNDLHFCNGGVPFATPGEASIAGYPNSLGNAGAAGSPGRGGGGGGAGGPGGDIDLSDPGIGIQLNIEGTLQTYAGGGRGGYSKGSTSYTGSYGSGGAGGYTEDYSANRERVGMPGLNGIVCIKYRYK